MNKQQQAISLLVFFCIASLLLRVHLFLAVIPYAISEWMQEKSLTKFKVFLGTSIWLLFLPNSPYMITDIAHLHNSKSTMIWYDLFMIFCFAGTGLLLAIISMHSVYEIIKKHWTLKIANLFIIVSSFLCGFGIYLGRFLRLNSWYVFTKPLQTLNECVSSFKNEKTWYITLGFGSLLWTLLTVYKTFNYKEK